MCTLFCKSLCVINVGSKYGLHMLPIYILYLYDQMWLVGNLSNFKNSLQDINWKPILINDDADEAYDQLQSILLTVFNEHFPIQTKSISNRGKSKPWITPVILAAIRRKRRLEKTVRQNPERFLSEYRRYIYNIS